MGEKWSNKKYNKIYKKDPNKTRVLLYLDY